MKIIKFLLIILISVNSIGCKEYSMNKEQIEELINSNLKPGYSEEKIINFLESQNWIYSFDRFQSRFQVDCPNSEVKHFIIGEKKLYVHIYVDETKSFKRAEVVWVSTGL